MAETNTLPDQPIFRARLTAHRSLGHKGFVILMAAAAGAWLCAGAVFLAYGAWPVVAFFGLDVALLYLAFQLNYRAARAREEVSISRTRLDISKISPTGSTETHSFNPSWTRFAVSRHAQIGITAMAVECGARRVLIGGLLNPPDRDSFADAFAGALAIAKSGRGIFPASAARPTV